MCKFRSAHLMFVHFIVCKLFLKKIKKTVITQNNIGDFSWFWYGFDLK